MLLPSSRSPCLAGSLSCLPRVPVTPKCLLCGALATIFLPFQCSLCQIFKGSYHVSFAKLHALRGFSSLHINRSHAAPQHLPGALRPVDFGLHLGGGGIFPRITGIGVHMISLHEHPHPGHGGDRIQPTVVLSRAQGLSAPR